MLVYDNYTYVCLRHLVHQDSAWSSVIRFTCRATCAAIVSRSGGGGLGLRRGADNYPNNWRPFDTMYIWLRAFSVKFTEHNGGPRYKTKYRGDGGGGWKA